MNSVAQKLYLVYINNDLVDIVAIEVKIVVMSAVMGMVALIVMSEVPVTKVTVVIRYIVKLISYLFFCG